jgi:hypothetical protein
MAARILGATVAAALLSGCGFVALWNEPVHRAPSVTPAQTTAEPDERTTHPYDGTLAAGATCTQASERLLEDMEVAGRVGGAITYPTGAMVKANHNWWTVVVTTRVHANDSGYTTDNVPDYVYYVTNLPTEEEWSIVYTWELETVDGDAAAAKALACAKRIPVPVEKPAPDSPASYTGKLAARATCRALSAKQLAVMQDVGQVGGAVTYPRGQMVRANGKWWTVAVATAVHANSQGYTRDNVPSTALFVTNLPTVKSAAKAVTFPIKAKKSDTAVRKALSCLSR